MAQPTQHSSLQLVALLSTVFCQRPVFFSNAATLVVNEVHIVLRGRNTMGQSREELLDNLEKKYWGSFWTRMMGWKRKVGWRWGKLAKALKAGCQRCQGWAGGSVGRIVRYRCVIPHPLCCILCQPEVWWRYRRNGEPDPSMLSPFLAPTLISTSPLSSFNLIQRGKTRKLLHTQPKPCNHLYLSHTASLSSHQLPFYL